MMEEQAGKEEIHLWRWKRRTPNPWLAIQPIFLIRSEQEYTQAAEHLNILIDEVGTDEGHPLYNLLDTLGTLVHACDERHHFVHISARRDKTPLIF